MIHTKRRIKSAIKNLVSNFLFLSFYFSVHWNLFIYSLLQHPRDFGLLSEPRWIGRESRRVKMNQLAQSCTKANGSIQQTPPSPSVSMDVHPSRCGKDAVEAIGKLDWDFRSAHFGELLSIQNEQESTLILSQERYMPLNDTAGESSRPYIPIVSFSFRDSS